MKSVENIESKQRFLLGLSKSHKLTKIENQLGQIIKLLSIYKSGLVLSGIAEALAMSVPTVTKLVKILCDDELVRKGEIKEVENGRPPVLYELDPDRFLVVGVEVLSRFLNISLYNNKMELIEEVIDREFRLVNDPKCLEYIINAVENLLKEHVDDQNDVLGLGVGVVETLQNSSSIPNRFFDNKAFSIEDQLSNALQLPVVLDNETRTIAIAEKVLSNQGDVTNALVVKVSRSLGLGLIINGEIVAGKSGFSGKLRHTQFRKGNELCYCGKQGCLGTQVGGDALSNMMKQSLIDGRKSIYFTLEESQSSYHKILEASLNGDELSLDLVQEQGMILGEALGNVVNLLNPSLIIISGEFAMLDELFVDAVRIGLRKSGIKESVDDCEIWVSSLGRYLSSKAGVCNFLYKNGMIGRFD